MSQINYNIIDILVNNKTHIRELARLIKTNQTTIARKVKELHNQNIIDYKVEGKNKVFFIKDTLEAKEFVYMVEHWKFLNVIKKYPRLRLLVEKIKNLEKIKLAIIFGSYAKYTAQKNSDIDLYIETSNRKIKYALEMTDSKASIKIGKFDQESHLAKEIIKNHIIIKGVERFYEIIH